MGPILFLCHINDLPAAVTSQVRLFADDCLLYREINTIKDHITLQQDLKNLEKWASTWGMRFNATKCYILSIKNKSSFHYQLNNVILKQVPNNPYLGILFSEDLKWTDHITKLTKKANSTLGFLRRNLKYSPTRCKRTAYLSLVRSILEYGAALWDPHLQKDIDMLERVQRMAFRFIVGDYKTMAPGTIERLHEKLSLPTLQDRRKAIRLTFMYKVVEGLVPAIPPQKFIKFQQQKRLIRPSRDPNFIYTNSTDNLIRNNSRCIETIPSSTTELKNSFFYRTAVQWNQLENTVVHAKSTEIFRALLAKQCDLRFLD